MFSFTAKIRKQTGRSFATFYSFVEWTPHPADGETKPAHHLLHAQFYLMCDDLPSLIKSLEAKKVSCTSITKERWGIKTTIKLPSGGEIGLYQPTHPTTFNI